MTLRTVPVDDPPAGVDWSTVVPGQYLYNVTAVAARLTTGGTQSFVMRDTSPNNNNGLYDAPPLGAAPIIPPTPSSFFVDGEGSRGLVLNPVIDWSGSWAVELWYRPTGPNNQDFFFVRGGLTPADFPELRLATQGDGLVFVTAVSTTTTTGLWETAAHAFPFDGDPHQIIFEYDAGTTTLGLFIDGAPVVIVPTLGSFCDLTGAADVSVLGPTETSPAGVPFYGAMCSIYDHTLGAGRAAAHYAARTNSATYVTEVLADAPGALYELADQGGAGGGRQVALQITDGMSTVELIPSGFPDPLAGGPHDYSWQPDLPASSQSPDGSLTTVAIPRLILPAGYTIGSDTLDMQSTDQWSEITVWWSDDVMDSLNPINPYAYPPGATLISRYLRSKP